MIPKIHLSRLQIITQIILWGFLFTMPLIGVLFVGGTLTDGIKAMLGMTSNYVMWIICFYVNYVYLIPKFFLNKHILIYILLLVVTFVIAGEVNDFIYFTIHGEKWKGTGNEGVDICIMFAQIILNVMLCFAAISFRVMQRNNMLIDKLNENPKEETIKQTENVPSSQESTFMFVKCEARQVRVNFDDILFISAMKDYVRIYLSSQTRPLTALSTMKGIEEKLPKKSFCRVHRSYIVSLDKIESIERNRIKIGSEYIPVSESYQEIFNQRLG